MYRVLCDLGTHKTCWTWAEALSWLAASGPDALVVHRLTGVLLARRVQRRAY